MTIRSKWWSLAASVTIVLSVWARLALSHGHPLGVRNGTTLPSAGGGPAWSRTQPTSRTWTVNATRIATPHNRAARISFLVLMTAATLPAGAVAPAAGTVSRRP